VHQLFIDMANWSAERWFVEVVGWGGALLILAAYLLVTVGRLTGQSLAFQWMNLLGAAGFVINGWWHRAIPSAALNVVWMLIAAVALWQLWKKRRSSTSAM
jgi:cell shape-determining protein MreD